MNPVRLTKKGTIFIVVLLVLLSAGTGYGLWVVNQSQTLSGTDTSAGGSGTGSGCTGKQGVDYTCDSCQPGNKTANCSQSDQNSVCGTKVCDGNGYGRYHCCDGTWSIGTSGSAACGSKKYGNCDKNSQACTCATFNNCGTGCKFPAGTQANAQKLANSSCSTVMAFCVRDANGNTKITYGDKGSCNPAVCGNPTATGVCSTPNVCDGGGLISPTPATVFANGGKVTFKGYAFDTDGINTNKINISVDGVVVGTATAVDACGANGDTTICNAHKTKKPVIWSYVYTSNGGTHQLSASWKDTKDVTGGKCKAATSITGETIKDNWSVSKVGAPVCDKTDPAHPTVKVSYTITITNSATQTKNITKVVDTLDSKVLASYILISTINPGATLNGNVITWTLTGTDATFTAGQSKTFKYALQIPDTAFGTYANTVVVTPETGSAITVDNSLVVSCTKVPVTGLFDSSLARVALGIILIGFGFAYLYSDSFQGLVLSTLGKVTDPIFNEQVKAENRRQKFERKLVKK